MATLLTGALLLESLGLDEGAHRLGLAVQASLAQGVATPDVGGDATTTEVADWIAGYLLAC